MVNLKSLWNAAARGYQPILSGSIHVHSSRKAAQQLKCDHGAGETLTCVTCAASESLPVSS